MDSNLLNLNFEGFQIKQQNKTSDDQHENDGKVENFKELQSSN